MKYSQVSIKPDGWIIKIESLFKYHLGVNTIGKMIMR